MNYKRIIRNPELRIKLLQALNFIPDETMLKMQYYIKLGRMPNFVCPKRYTEKIQLYKLKYHDPLMQECVDKYSVRNYVKSKIGEQYLNTLYGVYEHPDDIDFNNLPNQFILKDTIGSGDLSMLLVTDKSKLNIVAARTVMEKWVNEAANIKNYGREWAYNGKKHRIIAEKLLISNEDGDLPDYKFFCFDGKVFCLYMMMNYTMHHEEGVLGFFDRDFKQLPVYRADFAPMLQRPPKPKNYEIMVQLAERLAVDFPHVRVDFYNIDGTIIFGELTFYNASGYVEFSPDSFDFELGEKFDLNKINNKFGGGGVLLSKAVFVVTFFTYSNHSCISSYKKRGSYRGVAA